MRTFGTGASVTALCLALASLGAHAADVFNNNLIVNGDAEGDLAAWQSFAGTDLFTVVNYGAAWVQPTDPGPSNRGNALFAGKSGSDYASGYQLFDLSAVSALINQGQVNFTLAGYLGGKRGEDDNAVLYVSFLDAANREVGAAAMGPVYAADRGNQTGLLFRQTAGVVPVGTTQAQLVLSMERLSGYDNDGYADNLSFVLSNPQPVPEPAAYGLLLSGLAALSLVRARRRRAD